MTRANLIFENLFSNKLKFTEVTNPEALKKFFHSIWGEGSYNPVHLKWNLTIENKNGIAVVGSGHFVATYRKTIFNETKTYFGYKMGADTELYLDEMPLKKGLCCCKIASAPVISLQLALNSIFKIGIC